MILQNEHPLTNQLSLGKSLNSCKIGCFNDLVSTGEKLSSKVSYSFPRVWNF